MEKELKLLDPAERKFLIKQSFLASRLLYLEKSQGVDWILNCPDFSTDEKQFIIFNIDSLKEISKYRLVKFREEVEKFKRCQL